MSGRRSGDYAVGYGRPPVATRFKPGQSGNPKGRSKAQKTVGDHLRAAMMTRVKVQENGRLRSYTAQEVIIRNVVAEATRKNLAAIRTLFELIRLYGDSAESVLNPGDMPPDDREILQAFIDQIRASDGTGQLGGEGGGDTDG